MLDQVLDREDLALALILQDPILCMEFLRTTKDGSEDKTLWKDFKYRGYQKDIISDTNENISVTGGRSIGKCQIGLDRIYTDKGYKPLYTLKNKSFKVWAWDEEKNILIKRYALCEENGDRRYYAITTEDGQTINVTDYHPIWTNNGWINGRDIKVGDLVTKITKLPHVDSESYEDHEVMLLGLTLFQQWKKRVAHNVWNWRNTAIEATFLDVLEKMNVIKYTSDKRIADQKRYQRKSQHPITALQYQTGMIMIRKRGFYRPKDGLPWKMMHLNEKNLTTFLSAVLSQYATITTESISLKLPNTTLSRQFQELFLRYGVEMDVIPTSETTTIKRHKTNVLLVTHDYRDVYNILTKLPLIGFKVKALRKPIDFDITDFYRYSKVISIDSKRTMTYAVQVDQNHTYISEHMIVHNSYILEDKMIWDVLNNRINLVETPEMILTTANQAQLTPVLDKLVMRFLASPLLRNYISAGLNKQKGTIDWNIDNRDVRLYARIVGSNTESNLIGLHVSRIHMDEGQVFRIAAYRQLQPTLNTWSKNIQMFMAGVPNGLSNSALYYADQRSSTFKRYRIPATNNPFFTEDHYIAAIKDYGGEESDLFQNLVLGRWGKGSEQVIMQEDIATHDNDFYNFRYTSEDKANGYTYEQKLQKPDLKGYTLFYTAIDTGFVDPTIIQIFGLKNGRWEVIARYRLQRIEFPEQEQIINWLDDTYHFSRISIDLGSGGNAPAIIQSLMSRPEYKTKRYQDRIMGVMFQESTVIGYNSDGSEVKGDTKGLAARELVQFLHGKQIALSEVDSEGLSELERIARQKGMNGVDKYFILSEQGKGQARADHIFSSFLCFAWSIRDMSYLKNRKKKLGKTTS